MWLLVRESDDMVVGTNYHNEPPTSLGHRVVEWYGSEPTPYDPLTGEGNTDPTLDAPQHAEFEDARRAIENIVQQATAEIVWLDDTISAVDTLTLVELRSVLKRVLQEQRVEMRAWRYVARRFFPVVAPSEHLS